MKAVDETAINLLGIPSLKLMERAGKNIVDEVRRYAKAVTRPLSQLSCIIFCGKGNNGGDGFVAARLLLKEEAQVYCVLMEKESLLHGDAKSNFTALRNSLGANSHVLKILSFSQFLSAPVKSSVIIDAMFGTSFHGSLQGKYVRAVRWINKQKSHIIAVDIPSGISGDSGIVNGEAVRAQTTVTFSNPKIGFYFGRSREYTGKIVVTNIGIPPKTIQKHSSNIFLVEEDDIRKKFPHRPVNSHKHSVGKIFILAGSKGLTGAALLSSLSAMRSGAGSVILGIPESQFSVVAKRTLEVMPYGLASTKQGSVSLDALAEISKKIAWADVVLLGSGLSQNAGTQNVIRHIVQTCTKPMVIDADGLNALAGHCEIFLHRKSKHIILTPHKGEFRRLFSLTKKECSGELREMELAKIFAQKYHLTLVLKGAPTFTFTSNGKIFINSTGNPGMSTAGSGDVLSGIIAALFAQGNSAELAAVNGVYIHGKAGDEAEKKLGMYGMLASDILEQLPMVMKGLSN